MQNPPGPRIPSDEILIENDIILKSSIEPVPNREKEFQNVKRYLQTCSADTGFSLYDHLSSIIQRTISGRPRNVVDNVGGFSRRIKENHFQMEENYIEKVYTEPVCLARAKNMLPMLRFSMESGSNEEQEQKEISLEEDALKVLHYWTLAGYGFTDTESYYLCCALRHLEDNRSIVKPRFWGKIFGLQNDYYIVEATLSPDEIEKRLMTAPIEDCYKDKSMEHILDDVNLFPVKQTKFKRPKVPPVPKLNLRKSSLETEYIGYGANRCVYFVTTSLHKPWIELPSVTPQQIIVSRKIKKFLTGNLDARIATSPPFPGSERNYLRSLIARISAGTHICPYDFFIRNMNEVEVYGDDISVIENPDFMPIAKEELLNPNAWVHHKGHIHDHGRVKWTETNRITETQYGPLLFISCGGDLGVDETTPWTFRLTSGCNAKNSMVLVRSNIWPGAMTITTNKMLSNTYFGWGHKYNARHHSPAPLAFFQDECKELLIEVQNPTVDGEVPLLIARDIMENVDERVVVVHDIIELLLNAPELIERYSQVPDVVSEEVLPEIKWICKPCKPPVILIDEEPEYIATQMVDYIEETLHVSRGVIDDINDPLFITRGVIEDLDEPIIIADDIVKSLIADEEPEDVKKDIPELSNANEPAVIVGDIITAITGQPGVAEDNVSVNETKVIARGIVRSLMK